ncbi:MAG TPA: hypothetical protein VE999_05880 [Gemmataceae bacterium]|nr:hypothetical protein [Gemmataceae bacterium]
MPARFIKHHLLLEEQTWRSALGYILLAAAEIAEISIFSPPAAGVGPILRMALARALGRRLATIDSFFDQAFYLRQLRSWRRKRAARNPKLHYALIGRFKQFSPHPNFDPLYYNRAASRPERLSDPLVRYVRGGRPGEDLNECMELRRALAHEARPDARGVLVFSHARGGGSSRLLLDVERKLAAQGLRILQVRPIPKSRSLVAIEDLTVSSPGAPPVFDLATEQETLSAYLSSWDIERIIVNHVVDRDRDFDRFIPQLARRFGCPYDVILHDYFSVCPRINLVDAYGRYCAIAPPGDCVSCLRMGGSEALSASNSNPEAWRDRWRKFLAGASRVIAPSHDLATRIAAHIGRTPEIMEPEDEKAYPPIRAPRLKGDENLKILVLGSLSVPKGLWVVSSLGRELHRMKAPVSISVFGSSAQSSLLRQPQILFKGPYLPEDLSKLIAAEAPHALFFPSIWPETWSFVLSEAFAHGLHVMAFDIGAPAARLRRLGLGELLPREWIDDPRALAQYLALCRKKWLGAS